MSELSQSDKHRLADELRKAAADADEMASDLNNGRAKWRMCVPVQENDSDMIVARLSAAARKAADALESTPSAEQRNQCDGCQRGLHVEDGLHRDRKGHAVMACTADRYMPSHGRNSVELEEGYRYWTHEGYISRFNESTEQVELLGPGGWTPAL